MLFSSLMLTGRYPASHRATESSVSAATETISSVRLQVEMMVTSLTPGIEDMASSNAAGRASSENATRSLTSMGAVR